MISTQQDALRQIRDISPELRSQLVPIYKNRNMKNHMNLQEGGGGTTTSLYLEQFLGRLDTKNYSENKQRSMLYKERILNTTVSLGQDPDPIKTSIKGRDYTKIDTIDKDFIEAHRIGVENKQKVE